MRAHLGDTEVVIQIDIGFGDAVEPPAERRRLASFLDEDPSAEVYAYETGPVLAEKIETLIAKFPAIEHRPKDLLDVVVLARQEHFVGDELLASLRATFTRRDTAPDLAVLDEFIAELSGRKWAARWAVMRREKAVSVPADLTEALVVFDAFVRPLIAALAGAGTPGMWAPGGPWAERGRSGA